MNSVSFDLVGRIKKYINDHIAEYDEIIGTVFENNEDSNFVKLLNWRGCMGYCSNIISCDRIIHKSSYGLSDNVIQDFKSYSRVDIFGVDTDACVLAIAFLLFDAGINFRIISDCCFSSGGEKMHNIGIEIMKRNFKNAVI